MQHPIPLKPCPNCGKNNRAKITLVSVASVNPRIKGLTPAVVSRVNCSYCGKFYDGRDEAHYSFPFRYRFLAFSLILVRAVLGAILFLVALGIVVRITNC